MAKLKVGYKVVNCVIRDDYMYEHLQDAKGTNMYMLIYIGNFDQYSYTSNYRIRMIDADEYYLCISDQETDRRERFDTSGRWLSLKSPNIKNAYLTMSLDEMIDVRTVVIQNKVNSGEIKPQVGDIIDDFWTWNGDRVILDPRADMPEIELSLPVRFCSTESFTKVQNVSPISKAEFIEKVKMFLAAQDTVTGSTLVERYLERARIIMELYNYLAIHSNRVNMHNSFKNVSIDKITKLKEEFENLSKLPECLPFITKIDKMQKDLANAFDRFLALVLPIGTVRDGSSSRTSVCDGSVPRSGTPKKKIVKKLPKSFLPEVQHSPQILVNIQELVLQVGLAKSNKKTTAVIKLYEYLATIAGFLKNNEPIKEAALFKANEFRQTTKSKKLSTAVTNFIIVCG